MVAVSRALRRSGRSSRRTATPGSGRSSWTAMRARMIAGASATLALMRRLLPLVFADALVLVAVLAPAALAHDGGQGTIGEANDKIVTNACPAGHARRP